MSKTKLEIKQEEFERHWADIAPHWSRELFRTELAALLDVARQEGYAQGERDVAVLPRLDFKGEPRSE